MITRKEEEEGREAFRPAAGVRLRRDDKKSTAKKATFNYITRINLNFVYGLVQPRKKKTRNRAHAPC